MGRAPTPHLSHAGVIGFVGVEVLVDLLCQLRVVLVPPGDHNGPSRYEEESRVVNGVLSGEWESVVT